MEDDNEIVGFRFYPTEEELLCFYLYKKLNGPTPDIDRVIPLLPIYDYSPWELPQFAGEVCRGDTAEQWFFFTAMQEREARGGRINRLTANGYLKATGSPSDVFDPQNLRIGRKKTMVFYEGRAPEGVKTTWKMNEYKLYHQSQSAATNPQLREEVSLCRIYKRSKFARALGRRPVLAAAAMAIDDDDHINSGDDVEITDEQFNNGLGCGSKLATEEVGALEDSDNIDILLKWFDL